MSLSVVTPQTATPLKRLYALHFTASSVESIILGTNLTALSALKNGTSIQYANRDYMSSTESEKIEALT